MSGKNLKRFPVTATILLMALAVLPISKAQQTTEKFIPIGMSPGVSNKVSFQGEISGTDRVAKSFSIRVDDSSKTFSVTPSTHIWLDRSKVRKPSIDGSFDNLETGRWIEIRYNSDDPTLADWIKIETQ
jgi:hypothetical protein